MKEFINCDLILNNLNSLNENLSEDEIKALFSYEKIFESVDYIFKKCGLE